MSTNADEFELKLIPARHANGCGYFKRRWVHQSGRNATAAEARYLNTTPKSIVGHGMPNHPSYKI